MTNPIFCCFQREMCYTRNLAALESVRGMYEETDENDTPMGEFPNQDEPTYEHMISLETEDNRVEEIPALFFDLVESHNGTDDDPEAHSIEYYVTPSGADQEFFERHPLLLVERLTRDCDTNNFVSQTYLLERVSRGQINNENVNSDDVESAGDNTIVYEQIDPALFDTISQSICEYPEKEVRKG